MLMTDSWGFIPFVSIRCSTLLFCLTSPSSLLSSSSFQLPWFSLESKERQSSRISDSCLSPFPSSFFFPFSSSLSPSVPSVPSDDRHSSPDKDASIGVSPTTLRLTLAGRVNVEAKASDLFKFAFGDVANSERSETALGDEGDAAGMITVESCGDLNSNFGSKSASAAPADTVDHAELDHVHGSSPELGRGEEKGWGVGGGEDVIARVFIPCLKSLRNSIRLDPLLEAPFPTSSVTPASPSDAGTAMTWTIGRRVCVCGDAFWVREILDL
mmetsp:Transcript_34538/g.62232  ORF Transcript_34538/g.62232 Transcript_34538/m.62232 type:complete len:270 (+) Transcript_34538:1659-2468(+)